MDAKPSAQEIVAAMKASTYRVTYVQSGKRHTKTMTWDMREWYLNAWYADIRVTSSRKITSK